MVELISPDKVIELLVSAVIFMRELVVLDVGELVGSESGTLVELVDIVVVTEICITSGHSTRFIASEHISGVWSKIDSLSDTVYGREFSIYIITCIGDV